MSYVSDVGLGFHEVKVESLQLTFPSVGAKHITQPDTVPVGEAAILDTGSYRLANIKPVVLEGEGLTFGGY